MAIPRVFISSTYYDLKHVRNDICDFIKNLGYTPVMHDKGGVAYTQVDTLENSCYSELATCDIVICIIGNHFGTQSANSDFSITMEELRAAIKNKKKIYIFIAKDVFIENRTYIQNKGLGDFKPAYADDIKIHQFIEELQETVKNNPIESFETTTDIISSLRNQFAGLFQNLLSRDASLTEVKTAYDLQETTESFKDLLLNFQQESNRMFTAFEGTFFTTNNTIYYLRTLLKLKQTVFIVSNYSALVEFLTVLGFSENNSKRDVGSFQYSREFQGNIETLTFNSDLFDVDNSWKLKRLSLPEVKEILRLTVEPFFPSFDDDDSGDLPF